VDLTAGSRRLGAFADPFRIEYGIASSVAVGALSLIDPARLSPGWRLALRGVTAGVVGGLTLLELRRARLLEDNPAARAGVAFGIAGAAFGLSEASENLDARITAGLTKAGVRRPRIVLAVASTLTSIASFRSGTPDEEEASERAADGPCYAEIDPVVRELVDGMLAATPEHTSEAMRRQWATARAESWSVDGAGEFSRWLEFSIDEETSKVVPYDFTFPVKGQFLTPSGILAEAALLISGGRLRSLVLDVVQDSDELDDDGYDGDPLDTVTEWPAVHDVSFVVDTP
jgi:hypothetical protein